MIAIFDYGSGNLRSAHRAFAQSGADVKVTANVDEAFAADGLVVPGVGAYAACMEQLIAAGGDELIRARAAAKKKVLGICVGAQILFESGIEKAGHDGVGIYKGSVTEIDNQVLPHIGWNTVEVGAGSTLFAGVEHESFYFVHSFAAKVAVPNAVTTWAEYGERFVAAVEGEYISATQFHPEKSGAAGALLIKNWIESL